MLGQIQFALCGGYGDDDTLNPYVVTRPEARQQILSLINREHLTPEDIAESLNLGEEEVSRHLEGLQKAGLIDKAGARWKPSFAIFTIEDQERLEPLIKEMSNYLAKVVEENTDIVRKTHAGCGFADHGFSLEDLAYILVGAYILDFGALTLERSDFLVAKKEMPGGAYVFAGFEGKLRNLQSNWMWGHAHSYGTYTFFGHGELPPKGPRHAFPEQAYIWRREGRTEEQVTHRMHELGAILVALYEKPMAVRELAEETRVEQEELIDHLRLLQGLEYVRETGAWTSLSPVVNDAARVEVQNMVEEVWEGLLSMAVKPNWEHLERLYQGTSPQRNGIDIREAFNPIHHAIFEQALQLLMEREVIAWPKRHTDGARYAVWIEHTSKQDVTKL